MKKIPLIPLILVLLGLFLIFWAISFYYYNPTIVRVEAVGLIAKKTKLEIALIFFWGLLVAGIILFIIGIYKLLKKKQRVLQKD